MSNTFQKKKHRYLLSFPFEGGKIYKANKLNDAIKKCYKEFKNINDIKDGMFGITDLDSNVEYKFKAENNTIFKLKNKESLKGGTLQPQNSQNKPPLNQPPQQHQQQQPEQQPQQQPPQQYQQPPNPPSQDSPQQNQQPPNQQPHYPQPQDQQTQQQPQNPPQQYSQPQDLPQQYQQPPNPQPPNPQPPNPQYPQPQNSQDPQPQDSPQQYQQPQNSQNLPQQYPPHQQPPQQYQRPLINQPFNRQSFGQRLDNVRPLNLPENVSDPEKFLGEYVFVNYKDYLKDVNESDNRKISNNCDIIDDCRII